MLQYINKGYISFCSFVGNTHSSSSSSTSYPQCPVPDDIPISDTHNHTIICMGACTVGSTINDMCVCVCVSVGLWYSSILSNKLLDLAFNGRYIFTQPRAKRYRQREICVCVSLLYAWKPYSLGYSAFLAGIYTHTHIDIHTHSPLRWSSSSSSAFCLFVHSADDEA